METKVGTGYSVKTNSFESGVECVSRALQKGSVTKPDLVMVFCGRKHNPKEFLDGVNSAAKGAMVTGGTSFGIITNEFLGYEGYESAAAVFQSDQIKFGIFLQGDLDKDEYSAGKILAEKIKNKMPGEYSMILLYDSVKSNVPPRLNFGTPLSKGLEEVLIPFPNCAGAGLLNDALFTMPCYQFHNDRVIGKNVIAITFSGRHSFNTSIIHGCKPSSSYKTLTKVEGPVIYEIDNRPALEVIDEMLGENHGLNWKDFAFYITLGLNLGKKFEEFDDNNYANRLVLAVDEEKKALIMFEPDLKTGDEVQLMRRSVDLDYVSAGMDEIIKRVEKPLFLFYIDCAGRAKPFSGGLFEEAEEVQKKAGGIPFLGIYSGVELAKIRGHLQPLDWTGVVTILGE